LPETGGRCESRCLLNGYEVGGGSFKREGIYAYIQLTHCVVLQKPAQHCKATILK